MTYLKTFSISTHTYVVSGSIPYSTKALFYFADVSIFFAKIQYFLAKIVALLKAIM